MRLFLSILHSPVYINIYYIYKMCRVLAGIILALVIKMVHSLFSAHYQTNFIEWYWRKFWSGLWCLCVCVCIWSGVPKYVYAIPAVPYSFLLRQLFSSSSAFSLVFFLLFVMLVDQWPAPHEQNKNAYERRMRRNRHESSFCSTFGWVVDSILAYHIKHHNNDLVVLPDLAYHWIIMMSYCNGQVIRPLPGID